ncbi:MAG: CobW family GTP-binding protein [Pseudomonadota bacterium]|nr:CobW family GTP-binding protein [Pseudomonadota bacterium]
MSHSPLPVHLITGLLGSGKTTTLKHLIRQKPCHERWGILINEFGDIDIDAASLQANVSNEISVSQVSGGCVCCTAQFGLVEAINQLLTQPIDRLLIEPTGLGHPAKIIDTLKHTLFKQPLSLQAIVCVITPKQLTEQRWQKSAVMRDLVTLADLILLNKIDLSSETEQACSVAILNSVYPAKQYLLPTQLGQIDFNTLLKPHRPAQFVLLQGLENHQQQVTMQSESYTSQIPSNQACSFSKNSQQHLVALGWVWDSTLQFNRVKLKAFFKDLASLLSRAKGLLKTGNEWQLINWSEGQLEFEDIAWRQDSRLELLFKSEAELTPDFVKDIEIQLLSCIHNL